MTRAIPSRAAILLACLIVSYSSTALAEEAGPPQVNYFDEDSLNEVVSAHLVRIRQQNRSIEDVLADCRRVISQGRPLTERTRAIREQRRLEPGSRELTQQSFAVRREILRLPWYRCFAALRLIGESGDDSWIPVLDELFLLWGDATSRIGHMRRGLHGQMERATIRAYYDLVFGALEPHELVNAYRRAILAIAQAPRREDGADLRRRACGLLGRRIFSEIGWSAEVMALLDDPERAVRETMPSWLAPRYDPPIEAVLVSLRQLDHPNPEIRDEARRRYTNYPPRYVHKDMVSLLLHLLEQEELSSEGRQNIEDAIRVRGFIPLSRGDELIALPADGDGASIEAYRP